MPSKVGINRDVTTGSFPFLDIFTGFESLEVVRSMFDGRTDKVLAQPESRRSG